MTKRLRQLPAVVTSLCVMTGVPPQSSVATTAPSSAAGTALAQETVVLAGMLVIAGAVVSATATVLSQVLEQPFLLTVRFSVKVAPQVEPAVTETVWLELDGGMEPFPLI